VPCLPAEQATANVTAHTAAITPGQWSHYLSDTHFFCKYTEKTLAVQLLTDKNIPESAFAGCTSLESITLNSVVKEIQSKTFYGCNALTAASNFIRRLTAGSHLHS